MDFIGSYIGLLDSPVGRTVWERFRYVALLREMYCLEVGFEVPQTCTIPSASLSFGYVSVCKLSATAAAP